MKINRTSIVFLLCISFLLASGIIAQSSDPIKETDLSKPARIALSDLQKQSLFALGGVGYGGDMSKGETDLDILLLEMDAEAALYRLASTNPTAGGLYGLIGLRMLKSPRFGNAHK